MPSSDPFLNRFIARCISQQTPTSAVAIQFEALPASSITNPMGRPVRARRAQRLPALRRGLGFARGPRLLGTAAAGVRVTMPPTRVRRLGAALLQAVTRATRRAVAEAAARRTLVAPRRPQPPLTGVKASGADSTKA